MSGTKIARYWLLYYLVGVWSTNALHIHLTWDQVKREYVITSRVLFGTKMTFSRSATRLIVNTFRDNIKVFIPNHSPARFIIVGYYYEKQIKSNSLELFTQIHAKDKAP